MATEDEVRILRTSVERLSEQVSTLSLAIQTVNHLQTRQLELEAAAEEARAVAKATQEDIAENVVPRQQLQLRWAEEEKKLKKLRASIKRAAFVAVLAAVLGVGAALAGYLLGHSQLDDFKAQRLGVCEDSNTQRIEAATATRVAFAPLAAKYDAEAHPDPVISFILDGLAHTQPLVTNCSGGGKSPVPNPAPAPSPTASR